MKKLRTVTEWVEDLPGEGLYTFTREEAEAAAPVSAIAVQTTLRRLKQKGRIASPRRGFYVIVPPEYRSAGSPPASWFIDDLMRFLGRRYYVGLLSAAALHGSGHQQPMVFQVIADGVVRAMRVGRVGLEVHTSKGVTRAATVRMQTETGTMVVATPETTAVDLVCFPAAAGYWSNIATVLGELADSLDPTLLVDAAARAKLPDAQRMGFLLALVGEERLAQPLASWLSKRRTTIIRLRSDKPGGSYRTDFRFRVIVNEDVEPEL